jgi:hypothetical protein
MKQRISLRCRCGKLRGVAEGVSQHDGNRAFCYCDDCQAYAHFLGGGDILNRWGGTDIFQLPPAQLKLTDGVENLRCMRLSPRGLHRFYAGCCMTPIGNAVSARVPFVGVVHSFMDHAADAKSRDEVLGKPLAHVQGKYAHGDVPSYVHSRWPVGLLLRSVRLLAGWAIRGKGRPSAFFDEAGTPRVEPTVISQAENVALHARASSPT